MTAISKSKKILLDMNTAYKVYGLNRYYDVYFTEKDNIIKLTTDDEIKVVGDYEAGLDYSLNKTTTTKLPFSEQDTEQDNVQVYTCLQCGSGNVRETPKMIICNECGKRRKK